MIVSVIMSKSSGPPGTYVFTGVVFGPSEGTGHLVVCKTTVFFTTVFWTTDRFRRGRYSLDLHLYTLLQGPKDTCRLKCYKFPQPPGFNRSIHVLEVHFYTLFT